MYQKLAQKMLVYGNLLHYYFIIVLLFANNIREMWQQFFGVAHQSGDPGVLLN
jgi:hypothetical protein